MAKQRAVTNKVAAPAVFFISLDIEYNLTKDFSANFAGKSVREKLLEIPGIGSIVSSSILTGNQVFSMPADASYIQPVVGMGVSTIALPRPAWNSPFAFEVVSAIGWNVKTDFGSTNRALQYASS
jgi:hypothetical protein